MQAERRGAAGHATISDAIWAASGFDPARTALVFGDTAVSYGALRRLTNGVTHGLRSLGVASGDRVAVFTKNCPEAVACLLSAAELGAIHAPVNVNYRGEFLRHQLEDSAPAVVVCDPDLAPRVLEILPHLGVRPTIALRGTPADASEAGLTLATSSEVFEPRVESPAVTHTPRAEDPLYIAYTSGTTGPSKGAVLSNGYLLRAAREHWRFRNGRADDVVFTPLPLFHVNATLNAALGPLLAGATGVIEERFSVSRFWSRVKETGATALSLMGAMVTLLWRREPGPEDRDHSATVLFGGPIPAEIHRPFEDRFGVEICLVYGMSEATPISISRPGHGLPGSSGAVHPTYDVRIVDRDGVVVPANEVGEVTIRPRERHALFQGYWQRPQATVDSQRDLWFHTGDLARVDADGNLFFVDRIKDVIRRRGETISSYEVEQAAAQLASVLEVAAVGVPSELTEDDVMLFAVPIAGGQLDPLELWMHCDARLPYFAVPRYIQVLPELPKSPLGKVLKTELRARGLDATTWDAESVGLEATR